MACLADLARLLLYTHTHQAYMSIWNEFAYMKAIISKIKQS